MSEHEILSAIDRDLYHQPVEPPQADFYYMRDDHKMSVFELVHEAQERARKGGGAT